MNAEPNEIATGLSIGYEILKAAGLEADDYAHMIVIRVSKKGVEVDVTRFASPFGPELVVDHYKIFDEDAPYDVIGVLGLADSRVCSLEVEIRSTGFVQVQITREIDNQQGWALAKAIEGRCQLVPKDDKEGAPA